MRMRGMKISAVGDNNKKWHRRRRRGMKIGVIGEGAKWVDHFLHLRQFILRMRGMKVGALGQRINTATKL